MDVELFQLATVVLVAAVLGVVAKLLKQPLILAYLATGALIAYFNFFNVGDHATFQIFSDLGIMFLLFLVGMEINYESLRLVGKPALIIGVGQIVFTFIFGIFLTHLFGFGWLASAYIAIALTFSSTIIIVKLLSEKKDLQSLYGKISIGFLLVQDFVAILILVVLAGFQNGGELNWPHLISTILKGVSLFALMMWLGRQVLPKIFDHIARSHELLFLISLAWVFLLAAFVTRVGFSVEIAGFLAGIALANSSEHYQIASRIKALRDFFMLLFFAILGSSIVMADFSGLWVPVIVLSLFVLIGNPLIVLTIMGLLGYRKRTSFLAGVTVAQISEFSLVLMALGLKVGHVDAAAVSLVTAIGVTTITLSTYLIMNADFVFKKFQNILTFFEKKKSNEPDWKAKPPKPVVLVGGHRIGLSIAHSIPKENLLVVDFDPNIIRSLESQGFDCIFGDIGDPDMIEQAQVQGAEVVISTSPDVQDNLALLESLNAINPRPKIVLRAEDEDDARDLYAKGADYVLLPHFTSGQYLGKSISIDPKMSILEHLKKKDLHILSRANAAA